MLCPSSSQSPSNPARLIHDRTDHGEVKSSACPHVSVNHLPEIEGDVDLENGVSIYRTRLIQP